MSDNDLNNDHVEDSIPSVSDDDQKKKNQMFLVGMILLVAAAIAILIAASSGEDEKAKDDSLEAKVAEEYEVARRDLVIPAKQQVKKSEKNNSPLLPPPDLEKPKTRQPLLVRPTSLANNKPVLTQDNTESQEEKKARKKLAQLWEKRRKASPIIFDKSIELKEEQKRLGGNSPRRSPLDIDAITKNITDKVGNIGSSSLLGGGGDSNKMASRLNAAQTVGVTASYIADKPYTIAEGKMLGCILETAIQSNLPGMTRCILSENIYSYDGKKLLLKKGSRLVGQYEGGIQQGESRIFVIWTRIITPEGIDVALNSPGTGELGRAGHGVQIDSHFFERFGASALLSIVGGLTSSVNQNDVQFQEVGKSFNKSAEIALKDSIQIKPTGHKNQGERVKVFVARDIDFAPVLRLAREKLFN